MTAQTEEYATIELEDLTEAELDEFRALTVSITERRKHHRDESGMTVWELRELLTGYRAEARVIMTVRERHGSDVVLANTVTTENTAPVRVVRIHGDKVELYC